MHSTVLALPLSKVYMNETIDYYDSLVSCVPTPNDCRPPPNSFTATNRFLHRKRGEGGSIGAVASGIVGTATEFNTAAAAGVAPTSPNPFGMA